LDRLILSSPSSLLSQNPVASASWVWDYKTCITTLFMLSGFIQNKRGRFLKTSYNALKHAIFISSLTLFFSVLYGSWHNELPAVPQTQVMLYIFYLPPPDTHLHKLSISKNYDLFYLVLYSIHRKCYQNIIEAQLIIDKLMYNS
jgi:hypothetical protein